MTDVPPAWPRPQPSHQRGQWWSCVCHFWIFNSVLLVLSEKSDSLEFLLYENVLGASLFNKHILQIFPPLGLKSSGLRKPELA